MHLIATFNVFLWKHYKRLLFSWKKVLLSIIISSLSFFGILYFGMSQDPPAQQTSQVFPPLNLVIIFKILLFIFEIHFFFVFVCFYLQNRINEHFPTGIENKVCYVPNKLEFNDLMEEVRLRLGEVVYDRKLIKIDFFF